MKFIKKVLHDWFTEPDNNTWCVVKALSFTGALSFLVFSGIHVVANHTFDYQAFGIGYASLLVGAGGGLLMKKDTPQ